MEKATESTVATPAKPRNSSIELLRILAMIGIVAHHLGYWGDYSFATDSLSVNRLWIQFIQIGGKIGVAIFILISGYFLVQAENIKTTKCIKLWLQLFFYSLPVFLIFVIFDIIPFSFLSLVSHCLPIIFSQWWFATAYFLLYLFSPFLNRLLKSFNEKQYIGFLLLTGICWCIIPTFTTKYLLGNELLFFVFLYSVSGYIRLYKIKTSWSSTKFIVVSILLTLLTFVSVVVFDLLGTKISFFAENATYLFIFTRSLAVVIIALLIFMGFMKMNIGYKRIINFISPAMFGVYLIHENASVRNWLWKDIFSVGSYSDSNLLIPYTIFIIIVVFLCCTVIEILRIYSIERLSKPAIRFIAGKIDSASDKLQSFVLKKLNHNQEKQ